MSRLFDSSAKYLNNGSSSPDFPTTGSFAIWIRPQGGLPDQTNRQYVYISKTGNNYFGVWTWSDRQLYVGFYPNAENRIIVADSNWTMNFDNWHLLVYDWISGGASHLYLDGRLVGSKTTTTIFTGPTAIVIGSCQSTNANAHIARPACWNVVLSSGDRDSLQGGTAPSSISGCQWYYPISGASPETENYGGPSLTVTGSPTTTRDIPDTVQSAQIAAAKATIYGVLSPPKGVSSSKANIYGVLSAPKGVSVSKANVYAVISPVDPQVAQVPVTAAVRGTTPPVDVAQFIPEAVVGGGTPQVDVAQFIPEVITTPYTHYTYSGAGIVKIEGAATTVKTPQTKAYSEIGAVVIDGIQVTRREIHRAEQGAIIIDGEEVSDPQIAVGIKVTQAVLDVFSTPNAEINVTQSHTDIFATPNAEIDNTQVVIEPMVRFNTEIDVTQTIIEIMATGWQQPRKVGDWWIVLMRLAASAAKAREEQNNRFW